MRFVVYAGFSGLLTGFTVCNELLQRKSFFSTCVQLSESGLSVVILLNFAFVAAWYASKVLRRIFFGPLRPLEVERLYERIWFALTESFIAMTIFRDEFNIRFVCLFALLLGIKTFHWLGQERVDSMEQAENIERLFHYRAIYLIATLLLVDVSLITYSMSQVYYNGPSMSLMFGFEYIILLTVLLGTATKYVLYTLNSRREEPWENLASHVLMVELVIDFCKLLSYSVFFLIIVHFYGPPIHLIRDWYMTLHSFMQKFRTFFQYRRATANMDDRYPSASSEQLRSTDRTCIICRDEMLALEEMPPTIQASERQRSTPKILTCGHIFHANCLRSWLQRQQSCPTCRTSVFSTPPTAPTNRDEAQNRQQSLTPAQPTSGSSRVSNRYLNNVSGTPQESSGEVCTNATDITNASTLNSGTTTSTAPTGADRPRGQAFLAVPLFDVNNPPKSNALLSERLHALTDAELASLEGQTRESMIARLDQLHLIQEHLSGIVTQLSQIAALPLPNALPQSSNVASSLTADKGKSKAPVGSTASSSADS